MIVEPCEGGKRQIRRGLAHAGIARLLFGAIGQMEIRFVGA